MFIHRSSLKTMTISSIKHNAQHLRQSAKRSKNGGLQQASSFVQTLSDSKDRSNSRKKKSKCKKSNRRPSIPEKGIPLQSKLCTKSRSKKRMEGNISETRQSLPSRRNLDTISEASAKPPLKQNSKNIDEPRKGRKK